MRLPWALTVFVAVAVFAVAGAQAAQQRATATERPFLLHVDANRGAGQNCGYSEWSNSPAFCEGSAAPSGHSYTFSQKHMIVEWCTAGHLNCTLGDGYRLPSPAYTRWMRVCRPVGTNECTKNWLLGAVVMPNGPFAVVAGRIDDLPSGRPPTTRRRSSIAAARSGSA